MRILFLVRSTRPFRTQRPDVDNLLEALLTRGHHVDIYDPNQRILMDCMNETVTRFGPTADWYRRSPQYLIANFLTFLQFASSIQATYDACHILYVREEYLLAPKLVCGIGRRSIATLYGSDVNFENPLKRHFRSFYDRVTNITATSCAMLNSFLDRRQLQHLARKCHALVFPQMRLRELHAASWEEKAAARRAFGWAEKAPVILFGTNALPNEQHLAMAEALRDFQPPQPVQVVFPLTYGGDVASRRTLAESLQSRLSHLRPVIIDRFLTDQELDRLRLASTVFVNLRARDQMAASMFESFVARSDVVTGSWLPYGDLDDTGVQLHKLNTIDQLPSTLLALLREDNHRSRERLDQNRSAIWEKYNPQKNLDEWLTFYEQRGSAGLTDGVVMRG